MSTVIETENIVASTQTIRTHADLIVDYLVQIDTEFVFGVPGGAIEPFYNALARRLRNPDAISSPVPPKPYMLNLRQRRISKAPRPIITRHEAGAAFMAEGYARETGKLGVCCSTTGPGATNLITGVASAYAEKIPMLVITPQTALPHHGRAGLQESSSDGIDIVGMFEHCTRYNSLVSHQSQMEEKLYQALICAFRHPRGPVHLSIPMDILNMPLDRGPGYQVAPLFRELISGQSQGIEALSQAVDRARKVVLLLGKGCTRALNPILHFAEAIGASIITTPPGKGVISTFHPLYRGVFGFAGHSSARQALLDPEVDLVLAVSTGLSELCTGGWDEHALLNEKLVHIDANSDHFARSPMAQLHVYGDPQHIFMTLNATRPINVNKTIQTIELQADKYTPTHISLESPASVCDVSTPIKPAFLMRHLSQHLPEDTRFVIDAGNAWAWASHYLHLRQSGHYHIGMGLGAMAWGIGAAVGIALGNRSAPVVCITGDGSWLMSGQEITVAVAEKLPMLFVILNDQALGMVKHGQRLGGAEQIGFELPPVDFAAMARAMGANAISLQSSQDFANLDLIELLKQEKPTLIDVLIDGEIVPPIGNRVKVLQHSNNKGGDRQHVLSQ